MKGDFSKKYAGQDKNFSGVLHQQGRVLLDADWNAQTQINNEWQDTAAQDAFGPGVAAVPADIPHAFEVTAVRIDGGEVKITLSPGRVWADGLLLHLEQETELTATYLQRPGVEISDLMPENGVRDTVVLEVWREATSAFQMQDILIEPALGGPDTTERLSTSMALRLFRLNPGEACENIRYRLQSEFADRGKLSVSLAETSASEEVCPVIESGGYTGFEHHLFRIEVAQVNDLENPMFKWSRFNGGLVGRGNFHQEGDSKVINITANKQAIVNSGHSDFYLEVIEQDDGSGHWHTIYGAEVVLAGSMLTVSSEYYSFESNLPSGDIFFRLWDGIKFISVYIEPNEEQSKLEDGIHLEFFEPDSGDFMPGDYWTFPVRAGGIENEGTLLDQAPPEGIQYHRVALAEIHWESLHNPKIEDCRHIFRPLTNQKVCCSYTVGKGGDYEKIQEAIDKLPWWGGEICLLPGFHYDSVNIEGKFNIRIKGCDLNTIVLPESTGQTIFTVKNSWYISIEHMWFATLAGTAIEIQGGGWNEVGNNNFFAFRHAIQVLPWVTDINGEYRAKRAFHHHIHNNVIRMLDRAEGDVAIYLVGGECLIEKNNIAVIPLKEFRSESDEEESVGLLARDCPDIPTIERNPRKVREIGNQIVKFDLTDLHLSNPFKALGGIQIGGNSWGIKIQCNKIFGGDGNGIALGSGSQIPKLQAPESEPRSEIDRSTIDVVTINSSGPISIKVIMSDGNVVNGVQVTLFKNNKVVRSDFTEGNGEVYFSDIPSGNYKVYVSHHKIESINGSDGKYRITVSKYFRPPEKSDQFAFLYDIEISKNTITQTGLCGIGFPVLPPDNVASESEIKDANNSYKQMGNPVIGLNITGNVINNCLKNYVNITADFRQTRGFGGISLGMCEELTIRGNTIEDNGRDHQEPVCGIYSTYVAEADISDNQIVNNGPLKTHAGFDFISGMRGGIILRNAVSKKIADVFKANLRTDEANAEVTNNIDADAINLALAFGGFAVRIHDNLVKQPVGHALRVYANGPVSVANNQLISDFVAPPQTGRALAGTVLIKNYGQPHYLRRMQKGPPPPLPSGSVVFSNNQIRLSVANCWTSQIITSLDDITYMGNYTEIMEEIQPVSIDTIYLINTILGAFTLRATDNRFQEAVNFTNTVTNVLHVPGSATNRYKKLSLLSFSMLMNNTTDNQGNHCILAVNLNDKDLVTSNNLALVVPDNCVGIQQSLNNLKLKNELLGILKSEGIF